MARIRDTRLLLQRQRGFLRTQDTTIPTEASPQPTQEPQPERSQEQLRTLGKQLANTQKDLARVQSNIAYQEGVIAQRTQEGKSSSGRQQRLAGLRREEERLIQEIADQQRTLGAEEYGRAIQAAPRDYRASRMVGMYGQTGRTARIEQRQRFEAAQPKAAPEPQTTTRTARIATPVPGVNYTAAPPVGVSASFEGTEPSRPLYTSAVGMSTPYGEAEVFTIEQAVPSKPVPTPSFKQQLRADAIRFEEARRRGDSKALATAFFKPVVTTSGLAIEKGSQALQRTRWGELSSTTPTGFVLRVAESTGRFARTDPTGFTKEVVISTALGGVGGRLGGRFLQGVGSGRLGARLSSTRVGSLGLATEYGSRSVRQAELLRRGGTVVVGGGAVAGVGVVAATGGAEAVGRLVPSFVGAGVGFSRGFRTSGVELPSLRVLRGRSRALEPEVVRVGTTGGRISVRSTQAVSGRFRAYGGGRNIPVTQTSTFRGSRIAGTTRYEGRLFVTSEGIGTGGVRVRSRGVERGVLDVQRGTFASAQQLSSVGTRVVPSPTGEEARAVFSFDVKGGRVLGVRKGVSIGEGGESSLIRFRRGATREFRVGEDSVIVTQKPRIKRLGTQYLGLGTTQTRGTTTTLGRGTRGRLARALETRAQAGAGTDQLTGFRQLFTPTTQYGSALGIPPPQTRLVRPQITRPTRPQRTLTRFDELRTPRITPQRTTIRLTQRPLSGVFTRPTTTTQQLQTQQTRPILRPTTDTTTRELTRTEQTPRITPRITPQIDTTTRTTTTQFFDTSFTPPVTPPLTGGTPPVLTPPSFAGGFLPLFGGKGGAPLRQDPSTSFKRYTKGLRAIEGLSTRGLTTVRRTPRGGLFGFEVRI